MDVETIDTTGALVRAFTMIFSTIDRVPLTVAHMDNMEDYGKYHTEES